MTRALIYSRLSLDRNGEGVAVARQREDCLRIARERGWDVVGEYSDNSLSAWKTGVQRPGWEAMLERVGEVDALVVWHGDRLIRQPRDLERLIDLAEGGLTIASVAGERDLSKADDRFILRIETAAQCRESDSTSRRVKRALEAKAMAGERAGRVPYGWRAPWEAEVVRRVTADILAGRSLRWITRELNAEAIPAPNGGEWDKTSLRYMARRPANCGLRTHKGVVVGAGRWEPLVTQAQWEAVVRATDAGAAAQRGSTNTRRWLLTGILRCGKCGERMGHGWSQQRSVYRCSKPHLSVGQESADDFVTRIVLGRLEMPDLLHTGEQDAGRRAELLAEIAASDAKIAALGADFADDLIPRETMIAGTARARARKDAATVELAEMERRAGVLEGRSANFAGAPLDAQRAVVAELMTLTCMPSSKGRYARIQDRIAVQWRSDPDS